MNDTFDLEMPPRASKSAIAVAAQWLRDSLARQPRRSVCARSVPNFVPGSASCSRFEYSVSKEDDGVLHAPVAPLEPSSLEPDASVSKRSADRRRRDELHDVHLQGPRPGPPDLHAAVLTFPARLLKYVNERWGGVGPIVYRRAHVSKSVYSRLTSSNLAQVSKDTVMKLAIGLQLNKSDADLLMQSAGFSFSNSIPWDMAIVYCIEHEIWNLEDVNEILVRSGYEPFGLD